MMVEVVPALVLYCIIYMMSINSSPPCLFCDALVARSLGSRGPRIASFLQKRPGNEATRGRTCAVYGSM